MTKEQKDFLRRLKLFFEWNYDKAELNEREIVKEQLVEELKDF